MDFDALMSQANAQISQHLGSPATLAGVALRGVLSRPYESGQMAHVDLREAGPRFFSSDAAAATATRGQILIVGGKSFVVLHAEPDAVGGTVIQLEDA